MTAFYLRSRLLTWLPRISASIVMLLLGVNAGAQSVAEESLPLSLAGIDARHSLPSNIHDAASALERSQVESAARHDQMFNVVLGGFLTAASTDLAVSMYQIGQGAARERGFGAAWQDSPVLFAASKSAMSVAFAYGLQRVHKTRPKTAMIIGLAATSLESWLVVRSARLPPSVP